jgi:hypothetical protein
MERGRSTNIDLDWSVQSLDPNVQRLIIDAAQTWAHDKQRAAPQEVAPADGGRPGDEQVGAPVDTIRLLDTTTTEAVTIYDIEVSTGGTVDPVSVIVGNDGSVRVQRAE